MVEEEQNKTSSAFGAEQLFSLSNFATNCDTTIYFLLPAARQVQTLTDFIENGDCFDQLTLEAVPNHRSILRLGEALGASKEISSLTVATGKFNKFHSLVHPRRLRLVIQAIGEALHNRSSLSCLRICGLQLDTPQVKSLSEPLPLTHLSRLEVIDCKLTSKLAGQLISCFKRCPALRSLRFCSNRMAVQGAYALSEISDRLQDLEIEEEKIGIGGAKLLAPAFARIGSTRLRTLVLQGNDMKDEGVGMIADALSSHKQGLALETLDLSHNGVHGPEVSVKLAGLIAFSPRLTRIDLSKNRLTNGEVFAGALASSCVTSLVDLNISFCFLTPADVVSICKALSHASSLKSLNVNNDRIGDSGAKAISDHVLAGRAPLSELNLGSCGIGETGIKMLATGLARGNSNLRTLYLCENMIGTSATLLLDALYSGHSIQELDFYGCYMGDARAEVLGQFLARSESIRSLSVRDNNIRAEGIKMVCAGTHNHGSLERLNLAGNPVGVQGARYIAEAIIKRGRTLHELDIEWISMGEEGAMLIVQTIVEDGKEISKSCCKVVMRYSEVGQKALQMLKQRQIPRSPIETCVL